MVYCRGMQGHVLMKWNRAYVRMEYHRDNFEMFREHYVFLYERRRGGVEKNVQATIYSRRRVPRKRKIFLKLQDIAEIGKRIQPKVYSCNMLRSSGQQRFSLCCKSLRLRGAGEKAQALGLYSGLGAGGRTFRGKPG